VAKTQVRGGHIEVDGLAETIRALSKWDKAVRKEAVDIFRDEAKTVQATAKRNAQSGAASSSSASWIGRSATGQGAGVKLIAAKGNSRGYASEWGMHRWHIREWQGRVRGYVQRAMRRRTFRPWQGNQFDVKGGGGPGYVFQPAIRRHLPGMEDRVADRLQKLLSRELDKAGVRRG
jgi:hypothetical protein